MVGIADRLHRTWRYHCPQHRDLLLTRSGFLVEILPPRCRNDVALVVQDAFSPGVARSCFMRGNLRFTYMAVNLTFHGRRGLLIRPGRLQRRHIDDPGSWKPVRQNVGAGAGHDIDDDR